MERHLPGSSLGHGSLPSGGPADHFLEPFDGPDGLRSLLLERPDDFVGTITEKLMRFALGRSLEYYDMPEVRAIVRAAREDDYRWSSVILGVIESAPFQMRRTEI